MERSELPQDFEGAGNIDAIGQAQLLGSIDIGNLRLQAGIKVYPRLGDRVYSAPSEFLALLPQLLNGDVDAEVQNGIDLGYVGGDTNSLLTVLPERLFGRHCAVLGATGGGKSWTTARLVEQCAKFPRAKVVLVDATGEYRNLSSDFTTHYHLGDPTHKGQDSAPLGIPSTDFTETDFLSIFEPSGKVQGPKLREAMKSLRLSKLDPVSFPEGIVRKRNQPKTLYRRSIRAENRSALVDKPSQPFDVTKLMLQIVEECCWDNGDAWGGENSDISYCSSLLTRIQAIIHSTAYQDVFGVQEGRVTLTDALAGFIDGDKQVFRLCLSDVSYEFYAREVLANVIGRKLMDFARSEMFLTKPLIVFLDEAHNFLGKRIGGEEHASKLNSFEMIAKEGRKYGLNICLATQRPRDITEGVLSQMGTLLVHRLTNERDREVVEKACGEIDKTAAAFLPNLKQGEIALVGVDFPIPMTVQVIEPVFKPRSDSPSYQKYWA